MNGAGKKPPYSCHFSSPSPGPSPGPSTLGNWCQQPSDCTGKESCCPTCHCDRGDTAIGLSGCICDKKRHAITESQTSCCGGASGFQAWCAKSGTPASINPKCSSNIPAPASGPGGGVPTPVDDFYQFRQFARCVKHGCNSGYCDNPVIGPGAYCGSPGPSGPGPASKSSGPNTGQIIAIIIGSLGVAGLIAIAIYLILS